MSKYRNNRKKAFLDTIPPSSIESKGADLTGRCKFNFGYFDSSQEEAQHFKEWTNEQLVKLLDKLVAYTKESLRYWQNEGIGKKSQHVLEVYGAFPPKSKSKFKHPSHVPHDVEWARLRLESKVRLIGFVLPAEYEGKVNEGTKLKYDCNTFYVVFLDKNHKFYL